VDEGLAAEEIARPKTEAPAMKGVMLIPRLDRIVGAAVTTMRMPSTKRRMGVRVSRREALAGACAVSLSSPGIAAFGLTLRGSVAKCTASQAR
jgi:hypothetical protein